MNQADESSYSGFYSGASLVLAIALVGSGVQLCVCCPRRRDILRKPFQVSGPVNLEVQTRSGDITVRERTAGSVSIQGKIYVGDHWLLGNRHGDVAEIEQNPPMRQDGNSIRIDYVNAHDISVDYEITVPAGYNHSNAHSGSGDQTIEGARGNADLQSGSGDMRLRAAHRRNSCADRFGRRAGARDFWRRCEASAGSGDIEVEENGDGRCRSAHRFRQHQRCEAFRAAFHAEAGSGDITAEGTQTGAWEIRTGSGNVARAVAGRCRFRCKHLDQFGHCRCRCADHDDRAGAGAGNAQAHLKAKCAAAARC